MGDNVVKYLTLCVGGEKWVSYPQGLRFPKEFRKNYPFRGRGIVSNILYLLNKLKLDSFLLKKESSLPFCVDNNDIAFFWPSSKRSIGRFYAYKVKGSNVLEYWKVAISELEKDLIKREFFNVQKIYSIKNRTFEVAEPLEIEECSGCVIARYGALPDSATMMTPNKSKIDIGLKIADEITGFGFVHGDFAWHNIKIADGKVWVLDWEEMRPIEPSISMVDKICFLGTCKLYYMHQSLENVMKELRDKFVHREQDLSLFLSAIEDLRLRRISMGDELSKIVQRKIVL
jgi:hypothetical protein